MAKLLGVFGFFMALSSLLFITVAIGDLIAGDSETPPNVLVGIVVFFLGLGAGGLYLVKRQFYPQAPQDHQPAKTPEQTILDLALDNDGRLTIAGIAAKTHLSVSQAKEEMDALKDLVFDEMPAAMDLDVTLKVDAKWGPTWGDME